MENSVKDKLAELIQLALQVSKAADEAALFKQDCSRIKLKTKELAEKIGWITQQIIGYDRPFLRVAAEVEQALDKAHSLVLKCGTFNPLQFLVSPPDFVKISRDLDIGIRDVEGLWEMQTFNHGRQDFNVLSITRRDHTLATIWSCIAELHNSSIDDHLEKAQALLSLSHKFSSDGEKKLIIEEGGILPLLNLLKDGRMEEQEVAARIVGNLGYDLESVEHLIDEGVFTVFMEILKEGPMRVQAAVASAISKLAATHPKCKDICVNNNIIRLLINHLSFEMLQGNIQNFVPINKATTVLGFVSASSYMDKRKILCDDDEEQNNRSNRQLTLSLSSENVMNRQLENPDDKAYVKEMAAKALWHLVKDNDTICRIIIESKALMCFTNLLVQGPKDVQYYSIMALMEIITITEQDADLKRSVFRTSSPVWTPLIGGIIQELERGFIPSTKIERAYDCVIPSMKIVRNLTKKFRVVETRLINALVKFLNNETGFDIELWGETLITLSKLTCKESHLHVEHSKEFISKGGISRVFGMVASGRESLEGLGPLMSVLFCQIACYAPESEELAQLKASNLAEWATLMVTDRNNLLTIAEQKFRSYLRKEEEMTELTLKRISESVVMASRNFELALQLRARGKLGHGKWSGWLG